MQIVFEANHYINFDELINSNIYGILIGLNNYSLEAGLELSVEEINKINKGNKKIFLNIGRLLTDEELNSLEKELTRINQDVVDYYIYSDFGVYEILKKYNLLNKCIYRNITYVTNNFDASFFLRKNAYVFVSSEITSDELLNITKNNNHLCIDLFGKNIIFYSRRPLLTNYFSHRHEKHEVYKNEYKIIEESRNEENIIKETPNYSVIYEPNFFFLDVSLNELPADSIEFIYSSCLKEESNDVLKSFESYMFDQDKNNLIKKLNDLGVNVYKGAYEIKTTLLKEGAKNE